MSILKTSLKQETIINFLLCNFKSVILIFEINLIKLHTTKLKQSKMSF